MIKCEINKSKKNMCINGTLIDLVTESMIIVRSVYEAICNKDKDAAEEFKRLFEYGEELLFVDVDEAIEKTKKDLPKHVKKKLEVLDELNSLFRDLLDEDEDTEDDKED